MAVRKRGLEKGAIYPQEEAHSLLNPARRLLQSPARLARRLQLQPEYAILELGCGPGFFSPAAARRVARGRYVLFDLQPEMVGLARRRTREANENVAAVMGDGVALPFRDSSFDAAFMVAVLGEIPEGDQTLREIARVLRPGGLFLDAETRTDPDFIPRDELEARCRAAGLVPAKSYGFRWNYTSTFRNPPD